MLDLDTRYLISAIRMKQLSRDNLLDDASKDMKKDIDYLLKIIDTLVNERGN